MKLESLSQLPGKEAKFKSERNNSNHETHHHLAKHPLMTSKTKPVKSIQTNNQTTPHLTSGHAGCWSAWVLTVSSSTEPHDGPGNMREENCEKTTLADLDWCQLMPADASWCQLIWFACMSYSTYFQMLTLSSPCLAIFCVGLRQAPAATGEAPVAMQTLQDSLEVERTPSRVIQTMAVCYSNSWQG